MKKFISKSRIGLIITCIIFSSTVSIPSYSQVPEEFAVAFKEFYGGIIELYQVIKDEDTKTALSKIDEMEPVLIQKAQSIAELAKKYEEQELEIEEGEFEEYFADQDYFKEMMAFMADEDFLTKYQASPEIQKKMGEIGNLLTQYFGSDDEDEMYEEEYGYEEMYENNAEALTLEIEGSNSGGYTVMSNFGGGAIAYSEDGEYFQVEIMGEVNGGEAMVTFMLDNSGPGKQTWSSDGHFTLEFVSSDGDVIVSLWGSEDMGYIEIDQFGGVNEFITGKIVGKCMDMADDEESMASINAQFKVKRIDMDY